MENNSEIRFPFIDDPEEPPNQPDEKKTAKQENVIKNSDENTVEKKLSEKNQPNKDDGQTVDSNNGLVPVKGRRHRKRSKSRNRQQGKPSMNPVVHKALSISSSTLSSPNSALEPTPEEEKIDSRLIEPQPITCTTSSADQLYAKLPTIAIDALENYDGQQPSKSRQQIIGTDFNRKEKQQLQVRPLTQQQPQQLQKLQQPQKPQQPQQRLSSQTLQVRQLQQPRPRVQMPAPPVLPRQQILPQTQSVLSRQQLQLRKTPISPRQSTKQFIVMPLESVKQKIPLMNSSSPRAKGNVKKKKSSKKKSSTVWYKICCILGIITAVISIALFCAFAVFLIKPDLIGIKSDNRFSGLILSYYTSECLTLRGTELENSQCNIFHLFMIRFSEEIFKLKYKLVILVPYGSPYDRRGSLIYNTTEDLIKFYNSTCTKPDCSQILLPSVEDLNRNLKLAKVETVVNAFREKNECGLVYVQVLPTIVDPNVPTSISTLLTMKIVKNIRLIANGFSCVILVGLEDHLVYYRTALKGISNVLFFNKNLKTAEDFKLFNDEECLNLRKPKEKKQFVIPDDNDIKIDPKDLTTTPHPF